MSGTGPVECVARGQVYRPEVRRIKFGAPESVCVS